MASATEPTTTTSRRIRQDDIVSLLASSVGVEKAGECVLSTLLKLRLPLDELSVDEALSVLESIAEQPGIIGVTARFAKSRVHLRWARSGGPSANSPG